WSGPFEPPARGPKIGLFAAPRRVARAAEASEEAPVHRGVDFALRRHAVVTAPAPGIARAVLELPILGKTLLVDHGLGVVTLYAHLEAAAVEAGRQLARGDALGWAGDSGLAEGVILHYEVLVHGTPVDPATLDKVPRWLKDAPEPPAHVVQAEASTP